MAEEKQPRYRLTNLEIEEVSLVGKPANPQAVVVLFKSAATKGDPRVEARTGDERMAENAPAPAEQRTEVVDKAAMVALEQTIKALNEKLTAQEAANAALHKGIEQEARLRKIKEATAEAADVFKALPGTKPEELGPALLTLSEKSPDEAKYVKDVLTRCAEAISKSPLFTQVGKGAQPSTNAEAELDRLIAKALADNPKLNKYAAEAKVIAENPALYERLLGERN